MQNERNGVSIKKMCFEFLRFHLSFCFAVIFPNHL